MTIFVELSFVLYRTQLNVQHMYKLLPNVQMIFVWWLGGNTDGNWLGFLRSTEKVVNLDGIALLSLSKLNCSEIPVHLLYVNAKSDFPSK